MIDVDKQWASCEAAVQRRVEREAMAIRYDAVAALVKLGHRRKDAERAVDDASHETWRSLADLIAIALRYT